MPSVGGIIFIEASVEEICKQKGNSCNKISISHLTVTFCFHKDSCECSVNCFEYLQIRSIRDIKIKCFLVTSIDINPTEDIPFVFVVLCRLCAAADIFYSTL